MSCKEAGAKTAKAAATEQRVVVVEAPGPVQRVARRRGRWPVAREVKDVGGVDEHGGGRGPQT